MIRIMQMRAALHASPSTLSLWSRHAIRVPIAAAPRRVMSNDSKMAVKMRDELAGVMKKNSSATAGETTPPPKGFLQFMKANKTQFLNIGASFFCVLLAYQIVALRRSGRHRQRQLDETRDELVKKQSLLQSLTSDEFVTRVANECAAMVLLEENAKSKWSIGNRQLSEEELAEKLHPVIDLLLNERIGDSGLTEEEKKERAVEALRNAQVSQTEIDIEQAIAIVEDDSGQKVVQKRVFSM